MHTDTTLLDRFRVKTFDWVSPESLLTETEGKYLTEDLLVNTRRIFVHRRTLEGPEEPLALQIFLPWGPRSCFSLKNSQLTEELPSIGSFTLFSGGHRQGFRLHDHLLLRVTYLHTQVVISGPLPKIFFPVLQALLPYLNVL
jgi:hypothetical protein